MEQPTRDQLTERLFLPADVRVYRATADPSLIDQLHHDERSALAPMGAPRQAEFATARACAHAAMAEFGVQASIPKRDGGSPSWPSGIAGSISHTRGFCLAVVSSGPHAVGLDVEEVGRMKPGIERRILVDAEQDELRALSAAQREERVATVFAAKEAFYKAHYEVDARYLGFDAVRVHVDLHGLRFEPWSGAVEADLLARVSGRVRIHDGRVIVGVVIQAAELEERHLNQIGPLPSRG